MDFINRLIGKSDKQITKDEQIEDIPYEIKIYTTKEGFFQADFYDKNIGSNQFYDSIRLIANQEPYIIGGEEVINCVIYYYDKGENIKDNYKNILAQIDLEKLQTDKKYCYAVMKKLLNEIRVEEYLENGMLEYPKIVCGKYIGGILLKDGEYEEFFNEEIGKASHYSKGMVDKRKENKQKKDYKDIYEK